jgi:protein-S-isoprenylcysteine O-methyltransferase Ste14
MPDGHRNGDLREQPAARRALRRGMLGLAAYMLLLAASMVLAAGRLGWMRGWAFLAAYIALMLAATFYLWRTNPEVVVARCTFHRGAKGWDGVGLLLIIGLFMAMFPVAALDDGRFHWSLVPPWLTAAGYVLFLTGMAGMVWVFRVNKFAEQGVRIQTERGHKVIDSGAYAVVRHPLYAAAFFFCGGMPLALGSYWALIPSAIAVLVLVVRTALEDRMLQNELDGYQEYAGRVRYRLVPGMW